MMLGHDDVLTLTDPEKPIGAGDLGDLAASQWPEWKKAVPIRAIRVAGPFTVRINGQGLESVVTCDDGYLCVDARGYPYPVAADEFALIYEEATP